MKRNLLWALLPLAACGAPDDADNTDNTDDFVVPEGAVDEREDFADPTWADPLIFVGKPLVIPAATDVMYCYYTTYTGPTVGLHQMRTLQSDYGHHFVLAGTSATQRDIPDGTVMDCTSADALGMDSFEPIIIGGTPEPGGKSYVFELPEGMGARLATGQRIVLQSHYLNTTTKPIVVQDEIQFETIAEADIGEWVAPWVHTTSEFTLAEGVSSRVVDCTWEDDSTILYLGGHMHEWGKSINVTWPNAEGGEQVLYDIPEWDPVFRDVPPLNNYGQEPFQVKAGDTFRTTCTWDNDTGAPLGFPHEMCVTFGMRYPAETPLICDRPDAE